MNRATRGTPSSRILAHDPTTALPGAWKLACGRAVTLRPTSDGILRVSRGCIWATLDGPHGATPDDAGDLSLQAGRSLYVQAGQRIVMESWNASGASYFAWDPVPPTAAHCQLGLAAVLQPLADLRLAAGLALRASGQLATGLVRVGCHLVRPRSAESARRDCGALG